MVGGDWAPSALGCQCDVGGALGQGCEPRTGACRCRPNTQGPTCSEWVPRPGAGRWAQGGAGGSPWGPWRAAPERRAVAGRRRTTSCRTCTTCAWSWRRRPRPTAAPCASASTPSSSRTSAGGATRRWRPSRWAARPLARAGGAGRAEVPGLGRDRPGRGDLASPCPPAQNRGKAGRDLS